MWKWGWETKESLVLGCRKSTEGSECTRTGNKHETGMEDGDREGKREG